MESLEVYLNDCKAGCLINENGSLSFAYDEVYLSLDERVPISFALPLRKDSYNHNEIEPILSNLLPDDIIRTRIGQILKIPRENTFVSFFSPGTTSVGNDVCEFRQLTDDEAGAVLDNLEKRPLDIGEEGFRISGAGAQDKLIACVSGNSVSLPLFGTPSTHIIKTEIRNYPGSVENEWYSMSLAAACGLRVASSAIALIGGKRRFVSKRYDRVDIDGRTQRLHQEDFCQMMRIDPGMKYEVLGGPGIVSSYLLLRKLSVSASDLLEFIDRVIFNFLIGNGDAHGKNFSVVYHDGVATLAPMYDVMSTAVYPDVGKRMAMKIDDEYSFKWITAGKFLRMASKIGVSEKVMTKELAKMSRKIKREAPKVAARCNRKWPSAVYSNIVEGIEQRVGQIVAK